MPARRHTILVVAACGLVLSIVACISQDVSTMCMANTKGAFATGRGTNMGVRNSVFFLRPGGSRMPIVGPHFARRVHAQVADMALTSAVTGADQFQNTGQPLAQQVRQLAAEAPLGYFDKPVDVHKAETLLMKADAALSTGGVGASAAAEMLKGIAEMRTALPVAMVLVPSLVKALQPGVRGLDASQLADLLWSVAALRVRAPELKSLLTPILDSLLAEDLTGLSSEKIAGLFWSVATLHGEAPVLTQLLPFLLRAMHGHTSDASPQDACTTLWALTMLRTRWWMLPSEELPVIAAFLVNRFIERKDEVDGRTIAGMLWVMVRIDDLLDESKTVELVDALIMLFKEKVNQLPGRSMRIVARNLLTLAARHDIAKVDAVAAMYDRVAEMAGGLSQADVTEILWFAKLLGKDTTWPKKYFQALRDDVLRNAGKFTLDQASRVLSAQEAVPTAWKDAEVKDAIVERVLDIEPDLSDKVIAASLPRLFWAIVRMGRPDEKLFVVLNKRYADRDNVRRCLSMSGMAGRRALWWAAVTADEEHRHNFLCYMFEDRLMVDVDFIRGYTPHHAFEREPDTTVDVELFDISPAQHKHIRALKLDRMFWDGSLGPDVAQKYDLVAKRKFPTRNDDAMRDGY